MNSQSTELLRWVILLPLIGAAINGLFNRSKNAMIAGGIASAATVLAFIVAVITISSRAPDTFSMVDHWFTWFKAGNLEVPFHLELTSFSQVMLLVVTGIGSLIHIYAIGYMSHEHSPWRFFAYLNLFVSAMLVLVLSSSLVGVFLGWEGVGLCSYLLIGFWYKDDKNTAAGMKAFVTNRVGDLGFLVALFTIIAASGGKTQVSDLVLMSKSSQIPTAAWLVFAGGLFWASTGKSAQFPLYVWLPDAMAGPTPVSALIHAATMVTSGIVVITRLWPIFAPLQPVLDVMLAVGIGTAYLAALIALTQRDIKKVMAYSTVSQLGFMFAALGAGAPVAAFFHVVTHACFKALLFLGSGSVIHGMHEKQDMFEMGGLRKKMKITHITFLIATMAIIGFPLTAGFFSKDLILAQAWERAPIAYILLLGAAVLTAFYMLRAYTLTFWGEHRSHEASHAHESGPVMWVPLAILAFLSLFVGWFETPHAIFGIHTFEHFVQGAWYGIVPGERKEVEMSIGFEWLLMIISTSFSLGVAWLSYKKYQTYKAGEPAPLPQGLVSVSEHKFYVDEAYEAVFINPLKWVSRQISNLLDSKVINATLHGLRNTMQATGQVLSILHTGNVQTYAWYIAASTAVAILVSWMVLK